MAKLKKVVHLIEDFNVGGLERIVGCLAQKLDREQYYIQIWCLARGGQMVDEMKTAGVLVKVLNLKSYHNIFSILKLKYLLKTEKIDILHCHSYFANTFGRLAVLLMKDRPKVVIHLHTTMHDLSKLNIVLDKFLNCIVDKIIYISQAVKNSFEDKGYKIADKGTVIHNGVFEYQFSKAAHLVDKKIIVTTASLTKHKGHLSLVNIIHKVLQKIPETQWWLIGDGPIRPMIEQRCQELGIADKVTFYGIRNDIHQLLLQAHVCVQASTREGLGVSLIEAMAAALPVVATKVGGIPEVIRDGENGYLIDPADEQTFSEKIIELLENPLLARRMGEQGRARFKRLFEEKNMIYKIEEVYQEVLRK